MLIVGARGFAKEVLEIIKELDDLKDLVFYDDINKDIPNILFNEYRVLKNESEVSEYFKTRDKRFTIGIGNPKLRKNMYDTFAALGGVLTSTISPNTSLGTYDINVGDGVNILQGVRISNGVSMGKGCIAYYNAVITHDCVIGEFVELSPSVTVLGRVKIGGFCSIGANAIILPDIVIGKNVIIGAGTIVTKNIPDNVLVVGTPGRIIKNLE